MTGHYRNHINPGHGCLPGAGHGCACFQAGTRILTSRGEIPVEKLSPGDRVVIHDGGDRPIRWIGWRRISPSAHPAPRMVTPVRIAKGALGPNKPHRDLYVSPDHALYLRGALIPAGALINGVNVTQSAATEVVYYHVELDAHGVIFAEGAPAESFLEREGNRSHFANSRDAVTLHPGFTGAAGERRRAGRNASRRVSGWLFAGLARFGRLMHDAASGAGLWRTAGFAARLNASAEQRLAGAAAPCATFGPVVDEARNEITLRFVITARASALSSEEDSPEEDSPEKTSPEKTAA